MIDVKICVGSSCYLKGAQKIVDHLNKMILEVEKNIDISLSGEFCLGNCGDGVAVSINNQIRHVHTPEEAEKLLREYLSEYN